MKKALLIGNNYTGQQCALNGCINDVNNIQNMLITNYGYKKINITMQQECNKQNTLIAISNLLNNAKKGDTLFFYYSGHGVQLPNPNGTSFDEAIYTIDGQTITDEDFFNLIANKTNGATLIMIFDCCHSGDMCDLIHNARYDGKQVGYWSQPTKELNDNIYVFSGCLDYQTSSDASFIKPETNQNICDGAFTYYLLQTLKANNYKISNENLLIAIYNGLKQGFFDQIPQFSCSQLNCFQNTFLT